MDLPKGNSLRLDVNTSKVGVAATLDELKECDPDKDEKKFNTRMTYVMKQLSDAKMLRAQGKAVVRELAPGFDFVLARVYISFFKLGYCPLRPRDS